LGVFEYEGHAKAEGDASDNGEAEGNKEDPDSMEHESGADLFAVSVGAHS
jgi:hypothetical protein